MTQSSAKIRKSGDYIPKGGKEEQLLIVSDKRERYVYKFPNSGIIKGNLPVGDYALKVPDRLVAVVERKTLDNFLKDISTYDVLKLELQELNNFRFKAVFFDLPYSDFLNPQKVKPYKATYISGIIADFPEIQFVFCDNRKIATEWIYRWFKKIKLEFTNSIQKESI